MGKSPPTPSEHVRLFIALHDEYRSMAEQFPVEQHQFVLGGPPREPADRWHRIVRAMVLRKFFLQAGDSAHLDRVLKAAARALTDQAAKEHAASLRSLVGDLPPTVAYGTAEGTVASPRELVVDILYGVHMHGDYDRWQRYEGLTPTFIEHSLWTWTAQAESVLDAVRTAIDGWISEGSLILTEPGADDEEPDGSA